MYKVKSVRRQIFKFGNFMTEVKFSSQFPKLNVLNEEFRLAPQPFSNEPDPENVVMLHIILCFLEVSSPISLRCAITITLTCKNKLHYKSEDTLP